jgi:hypothetical protein
MDDYGQEELFSGYSNMDAVRILLSDLHSDLDGKVGRFHQLEDLSTSLGSAGAMLPGGEVTFNAWVEARSSFVHGNFIATVLLCQSLAEHLLAAHLSLWPGDPLPAKIGFQDTLKRSLAYGVISAEDEEDLRRLMNLRNPLSHFRNINDPSGLGRRAAESMTHPVVHLLTDATFAIGMAVRLLSLPSFRLDKKDW